MSPASPCSGVCRVNEAQGWCIGCMRTVDEIARWGGMSAAERWHVMAEVARRQGSEGER